MSIFLILSLIITLFIPFIICGILAGVIIRIVLTKSIKSKGLKTLIIISIVFCVCMTVINIKEERPSEQYIKMQKIDNDNSLIGLSKEEVIALLGEPSYAKHIEKDGKEFYRYHAGSIDKGLFLGKKSLLFDCSYGYVLNVYFDEHDKVSSTSMQCVP